MYLDEHKHEMFSVLESLPDFKIDMSFECESSVIPFLKNFTPHDTFKIYKAGSSIRLDFQAKTLKKELNLDKKQIKSPKNQSSASFLFKGRGSQNEGELLFVDHNEENGQGGYVLNVFTDMYINRIDEEITKLLKKKEKMKEYQPGEFALQNIKDWKGNQIIKSIDGYLAQKMKAKA